MSFIGKTASVFGVVGLSASIATLGVVESASAVDIKGGNDLLRTPNNGSSFFDFGTQEINGNEVDIGTVEFKGVPTGTGNADTIIQRDDCTFVSGSCTIDIEMTTLSLKNREPLNVAGMDVDVFVDLADQASTGTMTINDDGTFHTLLDVQFQAHIVEIGGGQANLGWLNLGKSFEAWGEYDLVAAEQEEFKIIGEVVHITPEGDQHTVEPVPEPTTIIGSSLALGFGAFFKKQSSRKRNKKDLS